MRRWLAGALALGFLASPAGAVDQSTRPATLTEAQKMVVEQGVRATLVDGESGRFRDIKGSLDGADLYVCGYVNAKNRLGGYVGWRRFYGQIDGETFTVRAVAGQTPPGIVEAMCDGYKLG